MLPQWLGVTNGLFSCFSFPLSRRRKYRERKRERTNEEVKRKGWRRTSQAAILKGKTKSERAREIKNKRGIVQPPVPPHPPLTCRASSCVCYGTCNDSPGGCRRTAVVPHRAARLRWGLPPLSSPPQEREEPQDPPTETRTARPVSMDLGLLRVAGWSELENNS